MNKKLLSAAVATGLMIPGLAAADVKIYGKMDVSWNDISAGRNTAGVNPGDQDSVSSNSSRLGFKGTEKLGNGLTAFFKIESRVNVAGTNQASFAQRNTYVGIKSKSWGSLLIGRHDTPLKQVGRSVDFFESEHLGENRSIFNGAGTRAGGADQRVNGVRYDSPKFGGGFKFAFMHVPDDSGTNTNENRAAAAGTGLATYKDRNGAYSTSLKYSTKSWFVSGAFESQEVGFHGGTAGKRDQDIWRLAAKWSGNGFTVAGLIQDLDNAGGGTEDSDAWGIGASYKFGNNVIKLTYAENERDRTAEKDRETDMWVIGLDHNFSKRTKLYFQYASLDNNATALGSLNNSGFGTGGGEATNTSDGVDQNGISIGMRHNF